MINRDNEDEGSDRGDAREFRSAWNYTLATRRAAECYKRFQLLKAQNNSYLCMQDIVIVVW